MRLSTAFASADDGWVGRLHESQLGVKSRMPGGENGREMTVAELLGSYIRHDNRHLGMIEALKGVMGLRGTATR